MSYYRNPGEDDSLEAFLQEQKDRECTVFDLRDSNHVEESEDEEEAVESDDEVSPEDEVDLPEGWDPEAWDQECPED